MLSDLVAPASGQRNRSLALWALVASITLCSVSCTTSPDVGELNSASATDGSRAELDQDVARAAPSRTPVELRGGRALRRRAGRIEAAPSTEARAEVSLPSQADLAFRLRDGTDGVSIEARLVDALPVEGEVSDDVVVYRGAHPSGADVFHRINNGGTEDYLLLDGPAEVAYEVELGDDVASVRHIGSAVEFLDASGDPRLRMAPPIITDAEGVSHEAFASVSGCDVDTDPRPPWGRPHPAPNSRTCTISISWNTVSYPALLDPAWTATFDMMQHRYGHGLVTLPSGIVLAAGGSRTSGGGGMALSSVELFNPTTGTWSAGMSMPTYAFSLDCFLVSSDTKVFCWGLYGASVQYTIAAPAWTPTGLMVGGGYRQGAAFTKMADGRFLFVSGGNPIEQTAEIFDPAGNAGIGTYAATAFPPARGRSGGGAVLLADNRVMIAGGWNPTDSYMLQTEIFNATTGGFIAGPNLQVGTSNGTAGVRLPDNRILIQGGYGETQVYTPTGPGAWVSAQTVPVAGSGPGRLGFVGGTTLLNIQPEHAYLFNAALNTWAETSTPTPRSGNGGTSQIGSIAPLAGGRLMLSGGVDRTAMSVSMATTEVFSLNVGALGQACVGGTECANGFCASGVCCSTGCNAGCQVCSAAGACGTAPTGTESLSCGSYTCQGATTCPTTCANDNACTAGQYCANDNTCKPRHVQGSTCGATDCRTAGCRYCASAGGCVDGFCCDSACGGSCNECAVNFGTCTNIVGAGSPSCGAYLCSGAAASCPTSCTNSAQCASTAFCNLSNQCETKHTAGGSCSGGSQCQTGLTCVDSVCCTSTCSGQCHSCNRAGSMGSCVMVTGAPIGRAACNGSAAPCMGTCSGSSASCTYSTGACRGASCASGQATAAASCDGSGSCPTPTVTACAPFACNDPMTGCETGTPTDMGMPEDMGMLTDLGMMSDGGTDAGETGTVRPRPAAGLCTASPVDAGAGAATNIALLFGLLTLGLARRLRSRRGQHGVLLASVTVATVLLALTGMSAIASAQPAENREDVARLHFQLGSALYGEGRFAQAAHEFELAYEASQRPQLLHNIYIAYRDAGMLEEALEALRRFVQMAPESETAVYQSRLISLEAQVTELRRLRAGQEATSETTAEVAATSASPPAAPEEPAEGRGGTQRLVGYALLGVGGVGVGTFIGSLVAIGNTSDDLGAYCGSNVGLADNQCQDVPQVDSAESRIGTFRRVAWASLGVGLAAAATSVTLLVLNKSDDDTPTASFACDRTGCVGVVQGRF